MAYRALTQVLRGNAPPVAPGEIVPDTYLDVHGEPQPLDFDRLLELGSVELIEEKADAKAEEQDGYADLKVAELKALAAEREIEVHGKPTKAKLVEALEAFDTQQDEDGETPEVPPAE